MLSPLPSAFAGYASAFAGYASAFAGYASAFAPLGFRALYNNIIFGYRSIPTTRYFVGIAL